MNKFKFIFLLFFFLLIFLSFGFLNNLVENHSIPNTNSMIGVWTQGTVIPTPSSSGGCVSYIRNDTGMIFYIGGFLDQAGNSTSRTEAYNVITNTWTDLAPCPSNIVYTGCARLKDSIYIVGGMTDSYFSSETSTVRKYNIRSNTWSIVAPLPVMLGGNKAASYQDSLIFCAGGMIAGGSTATTAVYLYNCNTNTWRSCTTLPAARTVGAFTIYGDSLYYLCGGETFTGPFTSTVFKGLLSNSNDKSIITWSPISSYPGTGNRKLNAAPWGAKGIIVGADGSNGCYTLNANVWTAQPNMPVAVSGAGVSSLITSNGIGKFIVVSGLNSNNLVNNTQIFTDTVGVLIGIKIESNDIPIQYSLSQNYPNPFNPITIINYQLPKSGYVKLIVYDILGKEISIMVNEFKHAGSYKVEFNGDNLASGIYLYKLITGDFKSIKKMILLK